MDLGFGDYIFLWKDAGFLRRYNIKKKGMTEIQIDESIKMRHGETCFIRKNYLHIIGGKGYMAQTK